MKNRTLIVAALVMVLLCVGLIFLGLRHENAGGGPGQSQTTDGQTADGDTQSQAQQDITATLAVCGDIMSPRPTTPMTPPPTPTATSPASSMRKPGRRAQTIPSATWRPR